MSTRICYPTFIGFQLRGRHLKTEDARRRNLSSRRMKGLLLGNICLLALGLAVTAGASPAAAKQLSKYRSARKPSAPASKLPFGEISKGPLEIFVSIDQQKLHLYSDGVHVADVPVATGVPGHLTPLGVFSVIERDRYHHSNLYSNAPMPYMQRITWSGVALHQGPGVGRQASHGCIRMPQEFAARLWMLPTMGMRVIIAHQELRPLDFSDPHLFVHKDATPTAALTHPVETAQKVDPGTRSDVLDAAAGKATHTAPASATTAGKPQSAAGSAAAPAAGAAAANAGPAKTAKPTLGQILKDAAADAAAAPKAAQPAAQPAALAGPGPAIDAAATGAAGAAAKTPGVPAEAPNAKAASPSLIAPITVEQVPLPISKPVQVAKSAGGPIAIFVSRKEGKIYVRQNFAPLFDAPVKIEHPEQPLGTHVFTAMDFLPDHAGFRWTVVTMPGPRPKALEQWKYVRDAYGRRHRVRVETRAAETLPESPAETPQDALARIDIPPDVIGQISQLIVPGSSLIVSDQGLGPETGRGTDFIVLSQ
jgi:hypothetical protein